MHYRIVYQLCQTVEGKDIVISEAPTDRFSNKFKPIIKKKPKYFIRVKRVKRTLPN
jgi:hypothetical protein